MPSSSSPPPTAARMLTPFSPMPPVNTIASAPPSSTSIAPSAWRMPEVNTSSASRARSLPAAAASSRSRTSPLTPLRPSRPLRSARSPSTSASVCPVCFMITGRANGSKSPTRLLCGRPDCGLMPMLVATLWPSRIAHSELEPPRWQEMIRKIVAAQHFGRARGDVAMARAVKAPAPHVILFGPDVGRRVVPVALGNRLVKAGLERRHQRNLRQLFAQQPHGRDVGRIVGRRHVAHLFHRRQHVGRHPLHAADPAAMHRLEPDGRHFRRRPSGSRSRGSVNCSRHRRTAAAWSGTRAASSRRMPPISTNAAALRRTDPFDAAARKLPLVGHVEQPVLEARRAEVGHEDLSSRPSSESRGPGGCRLHRRAALTPTVTPVTTSKPRPGLRTDGE